MSNRASSVPVSLVAGWLALAGAACTADLSAEEEAAVQASGDVQEAAPRAPFADRFQRADRVFTGTVSRTAVEERDVGHAAPLPYTHVTFRVDQGYKGATAGEELTLAFLGGPASDGRSLQAEGVPKFRVGDRDLLFARAEDLPCPLVDEDRGRIRLLEDGARTDAGTPLPFDPVRVVEGLAASALLPSNSNSSSNR